MVAAAGTCCHLPLISRRFSRIAFQSRIFLTMAHNQLSQLFVLANEFKEGDLNVGGTHDDHLRREARAALAALSLGDIARGDFVEDQVTEALNQSLNPQLA